MSFARKLVLLAMAAIAVTAMAAPSAFAQNEPLAHNQTPKLEVRAEPAATLCPAVTPSPAPNPAPGVTGGGCRVHASGPNIVLLQHVFGAESVASTCNVEFDARLDAQAEGYLTHSELTQGTQGTCTRRPCGLGLAGTPEGRAFSAYGREVGPGSEQVTALFCVENLDGSTDTHCEVDIPFTEPTNHRYRFLTPPQNPAGQPANSGGAPGHGPAGFRCELAGQFDTEAVLGTTGENQAEQQVEVNHVP